MDNHVPAIAHLPDLTNPSSSSAGAASNNPSEPVKRRPGRPKGSTKKNLLGTAPAQPKIKRPVGRPRKDGFPAGSVGPSRAKTKRDTAPAPWPAAQVVPALAYPQPMGVFMSNAQLPATVPFQIDPSLEKDDWAELARTKPNAFITTLVNALAAPNPVSTAGPTVEEAFRSHLGSLAPNPQQPQSTPSLYSILKTFWLPSSPAYFSLTASASTARTPSEHRFLYWDPQPLVFNGIACPFCAQPLVNKGRISSGPAKIYDIEKPFFIIGCEYICRGPQCVAASGPEGRKFTSTDASILQALPVKLRDEFPAKLMYGDTDAGSGPKIWNWKALGVSRSLWNMVLSCLNAGLKKDVILHVIYAIQHGTPDGSDSPQRKAADVQSGDAEDAEDAEGESIDNESGNGPEGSTNHGSRENYSNIWKNTTTVTDPSLNATTRAVLPHPTSSHPGNPVQHHTSNPSNPYMPPYPPYPYPPYSLFPTTIINPPMINSPNTSISAPSTNSFVPEGDADSTAHNKRSPRHCCKCGSQDCKGKGGRSFCTNPCQDCGKLECRGRNSRRPDKKCSEGWV